MLHLKYTVLNIIQGLISAWSGPITPLVNTAKEIYGGVARGISAVLRASDASVKNMAEMEGIFASKVDSVRQKFSGIFEDMMLTGSSGDSGVTLAQLFDGGAYVDTSEIAVLHDFGVEEVRGYVREMFLAMMVSNAWVQQGAYIFSREMSEELCMSFLLLLNKYRAKNTFCQARTGSSTTGAAARTCLSISATRAASTGSTSTPPLLSSCSVSHHTDLSYRYLGSTSTSDPGIKAVPGFADLEAQVGATIHDAMLSSIDAYNDNGYRYNASENIDDIFSGDIAGKINTGSRVKGIWSIPVCEVERSAQYDETGMESVAEDSLHWGTIDGNNGTPDNNWRHGIQ